MKFYMFGGGDNSVGIPSTDVRVTFEGSIKFDDGMIAETKEFLKELDDNNATVLTEEEYKELMEKEANAIKGESGNKNGQ